MKKLEISDPELGVLAGMVRNIQFFSPLTVAQLDRVLPQVMLNSFDAGETVFRKGDAGDAFYIVYKGKVDVRLPKMLLMSKTVTSLGPGQFFGEIALISREPRTATVVCTEPTLLFTLMAADFVFVFNENPSAAEQMRAIARQRKFVTERFS